MKRFILLASAALALCTACKDSKAVYDEDIQTQEDLIRFQTAVGKQQSSKGLITSSVYPDNVPFGSFAWALQKGQQWSADSAKSTRYITNGKVEKLVEGGSSLNLWTTKDVHYWPKEGSLTFFSYSPYAETSGIVSCSSADGIKVTDFDLAPDAPQWDVDFMVSKKVTDQNKVKAINGVPTVFGHKLSTVLFTVRLDKDDYAPYIDGSSSIFSAGSTRFFLQQISLMGIYSKATYNAGNWSDYSNPITYDFYKRNTADECMEVLGWKTGKQVCDYKSESNSDKSVIVMPQSLAKAKLVVKYWTWTYSQESEVPSTKLLISDTVSINTKIPEWEMNKRYTYNIVFSLQDDEIEWAPYVESWLVEQNDEPIDLN